MGLTQAYQGLRQRLINAAEGIRSLLKVGALAGLLVAALAFPVVGTGGLSAKAGVDALDKLSVKLGESTPPQTTYVYASDGTTLLSTFYDEFRRNVPLDEVAPIMRQAIISAEDSRFYEHRGVDIRGVARAMAANQKGGEVSQGASTLTMQYVRGALQHNASSADEILAVTEQTPSRKLREMRLATTIEERLTKDEIMEKYLNQVYFGHRAYGIYAASYIYFSKAPQDLTLAQAATLAGLVQAPSDYDPAAEDDKKATDRRNWVIDRMTKLGYISSKEAADTKKEKIKLKLSRPSNACIGTSKKAQRFGFFCDYVRQWWRSQPQFGATPRDRENDLRRGGYTIITSMDPNTQKASQKKVDSLSSRDSKHALGVTAVEPGTGRIKAMAVNRTFEIDQTNNGLHSEPTAAAKGMRGNYPNTVNSLLGGGDVAGYQAGSTFKMFTMLAALEEGMPLNTNIYSPNQVATKYPVAAGPASCGGVWCPSNASKAMTGNQTMWSGFGKSVNTYFAQLVQRVGAEKAVRMAERLGLDWRSESDAFYASEDHADGWGAFTLGVADTTPLEMAGAYATIAAEGMYCEPTPVLKAIDQTGREMAKTAPDCHRELSKKVARAATDAARCPTGTQASRGSCGGWSTASSVHTQVGRQVAGKTGTTDSDRAAWFVGYAPQLAVAAFMSDPDNPFNPVGEGNSKKPIDVAATTLKEGLKGEKEIKFKPPPRSMVSGK
ncbi:transglycosylase domain-containing protein [Stackebrandtia nassauensis]|uniref:Glycosyl transferase family 51 n=1 Tax=Stackebrandtia nassauensis (strain DSM 44728 / CIP 108903 / NRRL B-16338 / NBRC 102104 / LLR-40K-21) TaxID=446470 RepID=D3Q6R4_STANL|nr:transglycosylase domain-containing protein [Stackebrandtia nassauensis]ADD44307.1 glycosyl transferase family 51 [Stackebrandtia nassauensis DSM 44728]